jgi:hypothetical protein
MNKILFEMQKKYDLSKYGFFPSKGLNDDGNNESQLPPYFAPWENIRLNVTRMIKNETLVDYIDRHLPILECDSKNLPDSYLRVASVYISHISHAYCYEARRKCQNPKAIITFPDCIEQPWNCLTQRLGRKQNQAIFYDYFIWNVDTDCTRLFFNVFSSNTSNMFARCFAIVEKTLGKTVPHIYAIDKYLTQQTLLRTELHSHLFSMIEPIYDSVRFMREMINTSRFDSESFVNPALWAKTFATMTSSSREGELGMSGGAAPIFKLLDIFLGRKVFSSELGRQMSEKTYLNDHVRFQELIRNNVDEIHKFVLAESATTFIFRQLGKKNFL